MEAKIRFQDKARTIRTGVPIRSTRAHLGKKLIRKAVLHTSVNYKEYKQEG